MLDVLHYLFEENQVAVSAEHQESRDGLRRDIYVRLYGRENYVWAATKSRTGDTPDFTPDSADASGAMTSASGEKFRLPPPERPVMAHKDFIPPTPFDPDAAKPFGSVLDSPLR